MLFPVITKISGIKNKRLSYRESYSKDTGALFLSKAENVLITRTGQIVARRGMVNGLEGHFHSLWNFNSLNDYGLVIEERQNDAALCGIEVGPNNTISKIGIRDEISKNRPMYFVYHAPDGLVLYSNGVNNGLVHVANRTSHVWPDTSQSDKSFKTYKAFPIATHLAFFKARVFGVIQDGKEDVLVYSRPGNLGVYNAAKDFIRLKQKINTVFTVGNDLLVVSTANEVIGISFDGKKFSSKRILPYPVIFGGNSFKPANPFSIGFNTAGNYGVVANTVHGPCLFLVDGTVINLIENNLEIRKSDNDALLLTDESLIITTKEV